MTGLPHLLFATGGAKINFGAHFRNKAAGKGRLHNEFRFGNNSTIKRDPHFQLFEGNWRIVDAHSFQIYGNTVKTIYECYSAHFVCKP